MSELPKPTYDRPIHTPLWLENRHSAIRARRLRELNRQKWLTIMLVAVALLSTAQFVIWAIWEFR